MLLRSFRFILRSGCARVKVAFGKIIPVRSISNLLSKLNYLVENSRTVAGFLLHYSVIMPLSVPPSAVSGLV